MLSAADFVILSKEEVLLLYNALKVNNSKATYGKLRELGILDIVQDMEKFLQKDQRMQRDESKQS